MKVVLTRAAGPIAERLVPRLLAAGHDVRVPRPPDGVPERRRLPVGVRPTDDGPADVIVALGPDVASLTRLASADNRLLVVTDRDVEATEEALASGVSPWTLQVTGLVHEELAGALAERLVRLVRVGPAGRVPDFPRPHRSAAPDAVEESRETGRAERLGDLTGLVEQR